LLLPNSIDAKLHLITEAVVRIAGADFARIWIIRPGDRCEAGCVHAQATKGLHDGCRFRDRCLHLRASSGRYTHTNGGDHSRVPFGCYKVGRIASAEETSFLTNDAANDPRIHNTAWAKELGLVSFAGYRLVASTGAPLGVLAVFGKQMISPEDNSLLSMIADTASHVLQAATMEESLKNSEEQYKLLFEAIPESVLLIGTDRCVVAANQASARLYGYESPQQLVGFDTRLLIAEKDRERAAQIQSGVLKGAEAPTRHYTEVRRDGSEFVAEVMSKTLHGPRQEVLGYIGITRDITAYVAAEKALRVSEEKYRTLIHKIQVAVVVHGADTKVLTCNPMAEELLGLTEGQFLGKSVVNPTWQLCREDGTPMHTTEYPASRVFETRKALKDFICGIHRPVKNDDIWVIVNAEPVLDLDGEIAQVIVSFIDITGRKQAEDALQKREALLKAMGKMASVGGWEFDVASMNLIWTEDVYRVHEVAGDYTPTVQKAMDFYAPEARPVISQAVQAAIDDGTPFDLELPIITAKGNSRYVHALGEARRRNGKTDTVLGTFQDITERKRAADALRESDRRLSSILGTIDDAVWSIAMAPEMSILYSSPAVKVIYGREEVEFYQNPKLWMETTLPEDRHTLEEALRQLGEQGKSDHERRIVRPDGDIRWVRDRAWNIYGPDRSVIRVEGILTDITARKRAEEERFEMERRLQHAQRLESLGVLAGGIAHDFNNLLQIIVSNACFARDGNEGNGTALGFLENIDVASARAAALTKQMLAYAGKGRFVVTSVDLAMMVDKMGQLLQSSISKKASLRIDLMPDLPAILADASQMNQIIMNLIINASEALGDQPGEICVKMRAVELDHACLEKIFPLSPLPEGKYVTCAVRDTGCGMDEETQAKIFDPFFSTKFTGRGLGLSAVQGILRAHNGAVRVESQPGQGSTFTIYLPASENSAQVSTAVPSSAPQIHLQGTILIVDDEEMLRGVLRYQIEKMGLRVLEAQDGQEALEVYRQHEKEINLVILDYKMPKLDGVEALIALRKFDPQVRAILSSGYSAKEAFKGHDALGWSGFIQKPYQPKELAETIRKLLLNRNP